MVCRCLIAERGGVVESAGESRQKVREISLCVVLCAVNVDMTVTSFDGLEHIPLALQRKCEQAGRSYGRSLAIGEPVHSRALAP